MKKSLYIFTFLLLLISFKLEAQGGRENNNWYFGKNAGLTWNKLRSFKASVIDTTVYETYDVLAAKTDTTLNLPTIISSSIETNEGCFSESDFNTGETLFYSDGMTIWNRQNNPMSNGSGLSGHLSSAQSGIVIPFPGNHGKYIAFALGERNANNMSYSVIDMGLDSGLGDVIAGQKNIQLLGAKGILGETMTAVRHANKQDFWVIAVGRSTFNTDSTYLNVWKVTSSGINVNLYSSKGIANFNTFPDITGPNGYIRFSEDGSRFAYSNFANPERFVFGTFDRSTGTFTTVKSKSRNSSYYYGYGYGVEFSKSGKYLYLSYAPAGFGSNYGCSLYVFDFDSLLAAADPATVTRVNRFIHRSPSTMLPADGTNKHFGALGMGSDGYLYMTDFYSRNMYVIINPEKPEALKMYHLKNFLAVGTEGRWGLPNFTTPWFRLDIIPPISNPICMGVENNYELRIVGGEGLSDANKIILDFGDGKPTSSVQINGPLTHQDINFLYTYDAPGNYTITAKPYDATNTEITSSSVSVSVTVNSCFIKVNPNIRSYYKP